MSPADQTKARTTFTWRLAIPGWNTVAVQVAAELTGWPSTNAPLAQL